MLPEKTADVQFFTDRVHIRLITENDLELLRFWRNDETTRHFFFNSAIISNEQQIIWYNAYKRWNNDYQFIFSLRKNDELIPAGTFALYNIQGKVAEFGRALVVKQLRRKGIFFEACKCLFETAKKHFLIERVFLEVYSSNGRAIHVYQALGFIPSEPSESKIKMEKTL
ncbi:MAG: GNAT family N-acetyltransferase [Candidatus Riflebacteria bacterium]|nr:GNAT family N-acetyltransferase [Candidatus Riflebacteria bacterium]